MHPRYGGWFALRGVLIFKDFLVPDLVKCDPPDILPDDQRRIELLEQFNDHWQDYAFRDIIEPVARYSEQQKLYFSTPPQQRTELIEQIKLEMPSEISDISVAKTA